MQTKSLPISLRPTVWSQLPCLVLSGFMLDFGRSFRICIAAAIVHWIVVFWILGRNQSNLSFADKLAIRWGFFPCLAFAILVAYCFGR